MTGRRRRSESKAAAARRRHAWLEVVTTSGPFLTLPVAERAFPNGMPKVDVDLRARLRRIVADALDDPGTHRSALIRLVLADALSWDEALRMGTEIPDSMAEPVPEHGTVVRPDLAFVVPNNLLEGDDEDADDEEDGARGEGPERLLGTITPWGSHPLERTGTGSWTASPVERLSVLLRARDVPVGLTTDGRWWAIVWAPRGGTTGAAVFDASLWSEEPDALDAFVALLERARFLGVAARDRLPALLDESLDNAEAVTEQLSAQVREAVELLVMTLDRVDAESGGALLADVDDDELYAGVVTVMMRIVFLLFAEERRLLRSDAEAYQQAYAIGRLAEDLEQRADLHGPQTLEHRTAAWHRLLAVSRAVHGGVAHEDLRMPAYGGGLFDPDRYPWLEGRSRAGLVGANPPAVDDRTVLRILQAVQYVTVGGERRALTYRALDVEQIGYVYEGLLELEVRTADEPVLQLKRHRAWPRLKGKDRPPELPASVARTWHEDVEAGDPTALAVKLKPRTGITPSRLQRLLAEEVDPGVRTNIAAALKGDDVLIEIAENLAPVLRTDERGHPLITASGRRFLAKSERRATTGTHYTPRSLAEEVVEGALEPLCYRPGPLETDDRTAWQIRPSTELLALRVADIAMGSGAFIVAACRYLADRLLDAWQAEGRGDAAQAIAGREGSAAVSDVEVERVLLDARRLVAEHSLYGVDINPLAVEMAKLSLWLITMDDERPFGFLDDRLICGDSLLGLATWPQLRELHADPTVSRRRAAAGLLDFAGGWREELKRAADLRRRITAAPVTTIRDVEHKARLLAEAREVTDRLGIFADAATAVGLEVAGTTSERTRDAAFEDLRMEVGSTLGDDAAEAALAKRADETIQAGRPRGTDRRQPLHWPLAFPEIFVDDPDPGFDAIATNPPFLGGKKQSGAFGGDYLAWLQRWDGAGTKGSADLAARFVLRGERLLNRRGQLALITTNTLLEGATLEVGMLQATDRGLVLRAGRSSHPWPSRSANLEIVNVWATRTTPAQGTSRWIDGEAVPRLSADLQPVGRISGRPIPLSENDGLAFQGHNVLGTGFTMEAVDAQRMIEADPRNADVVRPYVTGRDLNQRPDGSASRWIVSFGERSDAEAATYRLPWDHVIARVREERLLKDATKYPRMVDEWWKFWQFRQSFEAAIDHLEHVLAIARVSNTALPLRVPTGPVYNEKCVMFALADGASLAVLSSSVHQCWVIRYTSTLRTDLNYTPSDAFATLPLPDPTPALHGLGERLDRERRRLMLDRAWGLTTTYNHVHDPGDIDPAVQALRDLHSEIDHAVMDAYGWDLDLEIGHHRTKIGTRWTVSPAARFELLDLLLEENHRRAGILSP